MTPTRTDPQTIYDLVIVGGGINGCGIARDAAGRGQKVLLVEQDDLASATSSWSSKSLLLLPPRCLPRACRIL